MRISNQIFILLLLLLTSVSCIDLVEDGIRVDYPLSEASLKVEPIASEQGAIDQVISYRIEVSSIVDIKSCIIQTSNPGQNGTGFDVTSAGFDDPFADHTFGTIKKNVQSFTVKYDYIIPQDINKSRLTFSIIDESGKVSVERVVEVVPGISKYTDKNLYARDKNFNDGFASIDGQVYPDIRNNYTSLSEENVRIQEKLDIIFFYDVNARRAVLAGPASNSLGLSLNVENNTLFKVLGGLGDLDLDEVTPESLIRLTEDEALLMEGKSQINNIKVGDVIGFITDLNAVYSLKTGLVKVKGLHPASVAHYPGVSYVLECDIVVQK